MGPRNPVSRGFSLFRRTVRRKQVSGLPHERAVFRVRIPKAQTHLSLVPRTLQPVWKCKRDGLKVGSRQVAGGLASRGLSVVSLPVSGSSPDRGVASLPSRGDSSVSTPSGAGQGSARVFGVDRRTPTEWADEPRARIAGTDPRGTGGWQRVGRSPTRPVLKHGPRSLTCARVNGS